MAITEEPQELIMKILCGDYSMCAYVLWQER